MQGYITSLKRKIRLKHIKRIRRVRDMILLCNQPGSEPSAIRWIRKYIGHVNNSVSYGGRMMRHWATVTTEHRGWYSWAESDSEALINIGLQMYNDKRDYLLSQN